MPTKISRRDFLKLTALSLGSLAFRNLPSISPAEAGPDLLARIGTDSVSVYSQPWDKSRILYQRFRDEIIHSYYQVISEHGPGYNPVWYRVWGGYIHSAHLQLVENKLNPIMSVIPKTGQLVEVTVPYSQAVRWTGPGGWQPVYRLYYQSNHWVVDTQEGPDGGPWYKIIDELLDIEYHAPAQHFRPIPPQELSPISPDVPPEAKRIEVSLDQQTLTAYEGDKVVLHTKISSGVPSKRIPGKPPTYTPKGTFHVQNKMPSKHMGDGNLTSDLDAYELPGVPWCCFFEPETGVATHGTYWHTNFGMTMSHGCVNMRNDEAKWIYRWTTPVIQADQWNVPGYGTQVIVS